MTNDFRLIFSMALVAFATLAEAQPTAIPRLTVPRDLETSSLEARGAAQRQALAKTQLRHDFRFSDQARESGISFQHQIVDDVGRDYIMVHYDHGNGLPVADIDGDGLLDLYFLTQLGENQLWRNLGEGRFENITAQAGVAMADQISVTASFADYDNDGDPDLYVTTVKMGNVLFRNDGEGRFTDVTHSSGLGYTGHSSGAIFFDYDRDGQLDLFLTNVGTYTTDKKGRGGYYKGVDQAFGGHLIPSRTENSILFRGDGNGHFRDVSVSTGLIDGSWSGDASFADLNQDGFPDLYVVNMQGDDHFYLNVEGRSFIDRTKDYFPKTPWGTMGIKFFDFNNDARLDLLLTDMHSDMTESIGPEREKLKSRMRWADETLQGGADNIFGNAFFVQESQGRFNEVSDQMGLENYWPWGVSVGDVNADGYEDVLITASMNYPFRYGINSLLLNDAGRRFVDSELVVGVEPRRDGAATTPWMMLDCGAGDSGHQHCKGRQRKVNVMGTLGSRSSAILDLDRDGDLDIVTSDFNSGPQVLVSNLADTQTINYLQIALSGRASNRDGLGAIVRVILDDRTLTQAYDGKSGYLTQSAMPLYFGLGSNSRARRIEVSWPSGARQTIEQGIPHNGLLSIVEPAD